jgi:hypothetical protein
MSTPATVMSETSDRRLLTDGTVLILQKGNLLFTNLTDIGSSSAAAQTPFGKEKIQYGLQHQ